MARALPVSCSPIYQDSANYHTSENGRKQFSYYRTPPKVLSPCPLQGQRCFGRTKESYRWKMVLMV